MTRDENRITDLNGNVLVAVDYDPDNICSSSTGVPCRFARTPAPCPRFGMWEVLACSRQYREDGRNIVWIKEQS